MGFDQIYEKNKMENLTENELSLKICQLSLKIHRHLGPGLYESIYEEALCYELDLAGIRYERQKQIPVIYYNHPLKLSFKTDLIIQDKLILEIKSVEELSNVHSKQLGTYLKLTNLKLGLLINFNVDLIKNGIRRVVNKLPDQ
jgi:GxxExxY protein